MANDKQHNSGNFATDKDKASRAGQQGGQQSSGSFAKDHNKASEAGHLGGQKSHGTQK